MARHSKYPWDEWLRWGNRLLIRGRDFSCQPYAMGIRLRQEATKRNRRVSIKTTGDVLDVTVKRRKRNHG